MNKQSYDPGSNHTLNGATDSLYTEAYLKKLFADDDHKSTWKHKPNVGCGCPRGKQFLRLKLVVDELLLHPLGCRTKNLLAVFDEPVIQDKYGLTGVCEKTLRRDFKVLQDFYHAPISYDAHGKVWCLRENWTLPSLRLGVEELLVLHILFKACIDKLPPALQAFAASVLDTVTVAGSARHLNFAAKLAAINCGATNASPVPELETPVLAAVFKAYCDYTPLAVTYKEPTGEVSAFAFLPRELAIAPDDITVDGMCYEPAPSASKTPVAKPVKLKMAWITTAAPVTNASHVATPHQEENKPAAAAHATEGARTGTDTTSAPCHASHACVVA